MHQALDVSAEHRQMILPLQVRGLANFALQLPHELAVGVGAGGAGGDRLDDGVKLSLDTGAAGHHVSFS
jgi:hypothetical protein